MTMPYRFRFRRVLEGSNPVLLEGEPGYDRRLKIVKIGDGSTPWFDLKIYSPTDDVPADIPAALSDHIESSTPHPVYDDGPSLFLLYENAKV